MTSYRDVGQISNELEFNLYNVDAARLISANGLPITHEVNTRDMVELNVSLARNIDELNSGVADYISQLLSTTHNLGGEIYGGASLLTDTDGVTPRWYRTTSLSEACAQGLLDIASQQIVIGVSDETLGFELFKVFRDINPVLLALTASSPFRYSNGRLEDTGNQSRRIDQYAQLCRYFPPSMWRDMPRIETMDQYHYHLQRISDEVNTKLGADQLDANLEELRRIRDNGNGGFSYVPFDTLEPHQIFWNIRIRPDHKNPDSVFSLELRVPDMPTTPQRIQMINSFVLGLAYYIADHGCENLPTGFNGTFDDLRTTARYGLDANINGRTIQDTVNSLRTLAAIGLCERGYNKAYEKLGVTERILSDGNDALHIREINSSNPDELRSYLIDRLSSGE
ncbi:MAG: glutamate-cysteine ligase family protein [Candidatus Aenigmatarchaeota archaeon]